MVAVSVARVLSVNVSALEDVVVVTKLVVVGVPVVVSVELVVPRNALCLVAVVVTLSCEVAVEVTVVELYENEAGLKGVSTPEDEVLCVTPFTVLRLVYRLMMLLPTNVFTKTIDIEV
jgi:hypothetical protein